MLVVVNDQQLFTTVKKYLMIVDNGFLVYLANDPPDVHFIVDEFACAMAKPRRDFCQTPHEVLKTNEYCLVFPTETLLAKPRLLINNYSTWENREDSVVLILILKVSV